ncbi:MAG TPA: sensor histidine kinase [Nitrososphaeraceae archaeon]|nr:sensor histidine kinase [Nitrososphaeraceae archaeon]
MKLLKNIDLKFPGHTKIVIITSIILIIAISYGLFFYLQNSIEDNLRDQLFDKQKRLQIESTSALSRHIGSDLDSIMARLQMLANSDLLQKGDLSSNKTMELLEDMYSQINTVTPINKLLLLNKDNIATANILSPEGDIETDVGTNFSSFKWVNETKATKTPVFSNAYKGLGSEEYRIAVTYPIINRDTGEYLGLIATPIPTVPFFRHYGNIYDINSQYIAVLDRDSVQLVHPLKSFIGKPFFGNYTQNVTGHNEILNNLVNTVMSGNFDSDVYEFSGGERLTTGAPIFVGDKPEYFAFVITPTTSIYSEINDVVYMQRIEIFTLLAGTTAAIIVLIFFLIKWNINLNQEVQRRTIELDESNKQLRQANEQLKGHEKMQRDFINVAAHELRTPVQPILGLSEVLLSKTDKDSEQHGWVNIIFRNAKRLMQLTENILDVTRIESQLLKLNREQFNLNDVIVDCVNDIKINKGHYHGSNEKNARIILKLQKNDLIVNADKVRIAQVILNLLSNAIKFSPENGGLISVSSEIKNDDRKEGQAIVSIIDNGPGIDSDFFPKLFSRFTSDSFSGTGLGLFVSKNIVEAHGGKIWAQNNKDKNGAAFSFSLPLKE